MVCVCGCDGCICGWWWLCVGLVVCCVVFGDLFCVDCMLGLCGCVVVVLVCECMVYVCV